MAKKRTRRSLRTKRYRGKGYFSSKAYKNTIFDRPRQRRQTQRGGFLNHYDFAYAGRDTGNQAAKHLDKLAPKLLNQAMNRVQTAAPVLLSRASTELDKVAAKRIESQRTGETLEKIA